MTRPAGWFHENYEVDMPDDPDEAAQYEADLADINENGPKE